MEKRDSGSFFHQQHRHWLPPDPSLLDITPDTSRPHAKHVGLYPHLVEDSASRAVPLFPFSGMELLDATDSQRWFNGSAHSHLAFPARHSAPFAEKLFAGPHELGRQRSPAIGSAAAQKRFLIFDHSGDKTTLMYTSGIQNPVQYGSGYMLKPSTPFILTNKEGLWNSLKPTMNDEHIEEDKSRGFTEDEMHEDTEELNALLCSDTESPSSDDEASTAHSPSTMTDTRVQELLDEAGEEVDSFDLPTKRRKLSDGSHDIPSQKFVEGSWKSHISSGLEVDARSSCGSGNEQGTECLGSLSSGRKRSSKERIRETVSILQDIIPSVKGKDATVVIDEAIHYLKSLKAKATELGLDSL